MNRRPYFSPYWYLISFLIVALISSCASPSPVTQTQSSSSGQSTGESQTDGNVDSHRPNGGNSADHIALDNRIIKKRLDNGLTYMIRHNDKPEERIELRLVVNAGSILEDDSQLGLAHFVEHMAFNGTLNFEKQALVEYLESVGMRFGPEINAYTSFDETVYMLKLPSDSLEVVNKGLSILRDWAGHVTFDSLEVEKERGVVIEEWRSRRGGAARIQDRQFPVMLHESKYALRLPIGTEENLASFDQDDLKRFYKDWYRPDLMTVIAVGDVDTAVLENEIVRLFSDFQSSDSAPSRTQFEVPDHSETLFSIESDPEAGFASVALMFKHDPGDLGTQSEYAESLKRSLFSTMLNRRLGELTQEADPPFIGAGSGDGELVRTKASFQLSASVNNGEYLRALRVMLEEVERVRQHGFTKTEFDRAKVSRLRRMEVAYNERDNERSPALASEYVRHALSGESIPGITKEFALLQNILPNISLDEINALVPTLMTQDNLVVMVSGPTSEEQPLPLRTEIKDIMNGVGSSELLPYDDGVSEEPLLANLPSPGSITNETFREELNVHEWTLSNGAKVILKPTSFKADEILFSASSPGGASLASDADYMSASLSTSFVGGSGVGSFNAIELSKKLTGKVVNVRPFVGALNEGFSGSTTPQDLETMFQLVYLYATSPRADSTVYASFMTRINSMMANLQANPQSAFSDTLSVTLSQYHPRYRPYSAGILDEVELQTAFDFFKDRFSDFSDFTFYLVGSFEPDEVKGLVEQYLAPLPATYREEVGLDDGRRTPDGVVQKEVYKGVEPQSQVAMIFSGDHSWNMEDRRDLRLLQDVLDTRLRELLREDLGGTYGVSVRGSLIDQPYEHFQFSIQFGCDPERVEELVANVWSNIADLKNNPPDIIHLDNSRQASLRAWESGQKENSFWLNSLQFYLERDMDPARALTSPSEVLDSITPEDISEAARVFLDESRYVLVSLFPEEQAIDN